MICPKCGAEYRDGFVRCADCDVLLAELPPRDDEVRLGDAPLAVKAAAGLIVVGFLLTLAALRPWTFADTDLGRVLPLLLLVALIVRGGLALAVLAGKRWAFFTFIVLSVLGLQSLPSSADVGAGPFALTIAATLCGGAAILLLVRRDAQAWLGSSRDSESLPAAWYRDPSGRHAHRYWDGAVWTAHVADDGVAACDPLDGGGATAETTSPS